MEAGRLRTYCIETWGCQMNRHDSERIEGLLRGQLGMICADSPARADLVLLNTCSVREKPVQKILSRIGQLQRLEPAPVIAVCGCVAQQEAAALLERSPAVRLVVGPGRITHLGEALAAVQSGARPVLVGFDAEADAHRGPVHRPPNATRGMVTVIEGCESNCTFCVVPLARGKEVSRSAAAVLREVAELASSGLPEVELLGQTINAYRCPDTGAGLADLLESVAAVPGLLRVRFITSHPRFFSDRLITVLARHRNLSRYLHLPFQAGSDTVLRRMHRRYTRDEYLGLVARIRRAVPAMNLSTDVIVGFPGETEEDFRQTLDLLQQVRFGQVFAFAYSPRPHTPAARLVDDVPQEEKKARLGQLFALTDSIARELNLQLVGSEVEVLIDGDSRRSVGDWQGRGEDNRVVNFAKTGRERIGDLVTVRITRASAHSLSGDLVGYGRRLPVLDAS